MWSRNVSFSVSSPLTPHFMQQGFNLEWPNRTYSTLTRELKGLIIDVSTFQALRLRTNQWQLHEVKYTTYSHIGFQASYFDM